MANDYISRMAANEALLECVRAYSNRYYQGIEVARTAIYKLPAADVRPAVRGKWNLIEHPLEKAAICECSECKNRIWKYDGDDGWNFCPNCGADMREVKTDG